MPFSTESLAGRSWKSGSLLLPAPFTSLPLVRVEAVQDLARAAAGRIGTNTKPTLEMIGDARGLVEDFAMEIAARDITITVDIGNRTIDASVRYGKAVGHKADLNLGDCFAYACAKAHRLTLLYKGNDFSPTDLA